MAQVYLIVSPTPYDFPQGVSDGVAPCFFIKFGDGQLIYPNTNRYHSHNPSFHQEACQNVDIGVYHATGLGTYLKTALLANGLHLQQVGATEWFKIRPGAGGIGVLAAFLNNMLNAFAAENFRAQPPLNRNQVATAWVNTCIGIMGTAGAGQGFH